MNKILTFIFLGISLIFIAGCQTTSDSVVSSSFSSVDMFGKKACKGKDIKKWNNCSGYGLVVIGDDYIVAHAVWENGKRNGEGTIYNSSTKEECNATYQNDKLNGLYRCTVKGIESSRTYYVNGVEKKGKAKQVQTASYSKECTGLGFTKGSEKHGECILKLREISALEKSSNRGQTKILISDVKKQTSDLDKLAGLAMMLNGLNMGANLTSQSSSKVDMICRNDCLSKNYGYSFCSSVCGY